MKKITITALSIITLMSGSTIAAQPGQGNPKKNTSPEVLNEFDMISSFGHLEYTKSILTKNPKIAEEINSKRNTEYVGFRINNPKVMELILKSDTFLLERQDTDSRNLVLFLLASYFQDATNIPEGLIHKEIIDFYKKNDPKVAEFASQTFKPKDSTDVFNFQQYIISLMKLETKKQLNDTDKFGNSALSYAVFNRNEHIVKYLLENPDFTQENMKNKFGENALYALLSRNCTVTEDIKKDQTILTLLLENKVNYKLKNLHGYSFEELVTAIPKYSYLLDILNKYENNKTTGLLYEKQLKTIMKLKEKIIQDPEMNEPNYNWHNYFNSRSDNHSYSILDCGYTNYKTNNIKK